MAKFEHHIAQSTNNLRFLEEVNAKISNCFDWQVTVCFYTALHVVNAHLATYNLQYRKHRDVNHALNFATLTSPARLPEEIYISYIALQSLSRRSRYLVNEKDRNLSADGAFLTYEKHLAKAIGHLDNVLNHFVAQYSIKAFSPVSIRCVGLSQDLKWFRVNSK